MASIPPNENDNTNNNAQDMKDVAKKLTDLHLIASSTPTDPSLGSQFKYADEENIHKEFICCICFAPFLNPVTHSSCGNMFCRQCLQSQQSCPLCRGTLGNSIQPVPKPVLNFLDALKVICNNCNETVERGNIAVHQQNCPVDCPHQCGNKVAPKDQHKHETEECPNCTQPCKGVHVGCLFTGKREQLIQHMDSCPYIQLHDVLLAYKKQVEHLQLQITELEQKVASSKKKYVSLKSHYNKYLCCDKKGKVTADRLNQSTWEAFQLKEIGDKYVSLKTFHGKWLCAEKDGSIVGNRDVRHNWETFIKVEMGPNKWALKSHHGTYLFTDSNGKVMCTSSAPYAWEVAYV